MTVQCLERVDMVLCTQYHGLHVCKPCVCVFVLYSYSNKVPFLMKVDCEKRHETCKEKTLHEVQMVQMVFLRARGGYTS